MLNNIVNNQNINVLRTDDNIRIKSRTMVNSPAFLTLNSKYIESDINNHHNSSKEKKKENSISSYSKSIKKTNNRKISQSKSSSAYPNHSSNSHTKNNYNSSNPTIKYNKKIIGKTKTNLERINTNNINNSRSKSKKSSNNKKSNQINSIKNASEQNNLDKKKIQTHIKNNISHQISPYMNSSNVVNSNIYLSSNNSGRSSVNKKEYTLKQMKNKETKRLVVEIDDIKEEYFNESTSRNINKNFNTNFNTNHLNDASIINKEIKKRKGVLADTRLITDIRRENTNIVLNPNEIKFDKFNYNNKKLISNPNTDTNTNSNHDLIFENNKYQYHNVKK